MKEQLPGNYAMHKKEVDDKATLTINYYVLYERHERRFKKKKEKEKEINVGFHMMSPRDCGLIKSTCCVNCTYPFSDACAKMLRPIVRLENKLYYLHTHFLK